jgi:hypothetical protein
MVIVPHKMVGLVRLLHYRAIRLQRLDCMPVVCVKCVHIEVALEMA